VWHVGTGHGATREAHHGEGSRLSPSQEGCSHGIRWPSPRFRRVGAHDSSFDACSGFTHVAARRLADPPRWPVVPKASATRSPSWLPRQLPGCTDMNRPGLPESSLVENHQVSRDRLTVMIGLLELGREYVPQRGEQAAAVVPRDPRVPSDALERLDGIAPTASPSGLRDAQRLADHQGAREHEQQGDRMQAERAE
jgi:hypothetical protein